MDGKTVSKPLILALKEAENALFASVNAVIRESGVPLSLLEPTFDKIHRQIKEGAEQELKHSIAQYTQDVERANAEALEGEGEEEKAGDTE